jgi:titin
VSGLVSAVVGDRARSTGGSPITDYLIQRSPNGLTWTTVNDGVSVARTGTITGLANGTSYRIPVAAGNAVGTSAYSTIITATPR